MMVGAEDEATELDEAAPTGGPILHAGDIMEDTPQNEEAACGSDEVLETVELGPDGRPEQEERSSRIDKELAASAELVPATSSPSCERNPPDFQESISESDDGHEKEVPQKACESSPPAAPEVLSEVEIGKRLYAQDATWRAAHDLNASSVTFAGDTALPSVGESVTSVSKDACNVVDVVMEVEMPTRTAEGASSMCSPEVVTQASSPAKVAADGTTTASPVWPIFLLTNHADEAFGEQASAVDEPMPLESAEASIPGSPCDELGSAHDPAEQEGQPPGISEEPAEAEAAHCIGNAVEVRDAGHCEDWKPARVTSVEPLQVRVDGWSWSTSWDEVRTKEETPQCPGCDDAMAWSSSDTGPYTDGWWCNNYAECGSRSSTVGKFRWCCLRCTHDFCGRCKPHKEDVTMVSASVPGSTRNAGGIFCAESRTPAASVKPSGARKAHARDLVAAWRKEGDSNAQIRSRLLLQGYSRSAVHNHLPLYADVAAWRTEGVSDKQIRANLRLEGFATVKGVATLCPFTDADITALREEGLCNKQIRAYLQVNAAGNVMKLCPFTTRKCPLGHELEASAKKHNGWICAGTMCKGGTTRNIKNFCCKLCNYDLCEKCAVIEAPFFIGEAVEVRDVGHCAEWKLACVTCVEPLRLKVEGWSWSTSWDEVRSKEVEVVPEAIAEPIAVACKQISPADVCTDVQDDDCWRCPVPGCDHTMRKGSAGCRPHIKKKHAELCNIPCKCLHACLMCVPELVFLHGSKNPSASSVNKRPPPAALPDRGVKVLKTSRAVDKQMLPLPSQLQHAIWLRSEDNCRLAARLKVLARVKELRLWVCNGVKRDELLAHLQTSMSSDVSSEMKEAVLAEDFAFESCCERLNLDVQAIKDDRKAIKKGTLSVCGDTLATLEARLKALTEAISLCGGLPGLNLKSTSGKILGPKSRLVEQIRMCLEQIGSSGMALTPGLVTEILASSFDFDDCCEKFSLAPRRKHKRTCCCAVHNVHSEEELEKLDAKPKKVVEEVLTEELVDPSVKLGETATVLLAPFASDVPSGLIPKDAKVKMLASNSAGQHVLASECSTAVLQAAKVKGLRPRVAWRGLGQVPNGIPKSFRSVLFCGDSGSGKTSALRGFLESRCKGLQACPGTFVQLRSSEGGFQSGARGFGVVLENEVAKLDTCRVRLEDGEIVQLPRSEVVLAVAPAFDVATWGHGSLLRAFGSTRQDVQAGIEALTAVGLSSVPSWFKPYAVLSQGQKYRANLAMLLHRRVSNVAPSAGAVPIVLDEFTSELDRQVAKMMAMALRKRMCAGASTDGWVMATCNSDIIPYLAPEWLVICKSGEAPKLLPGPANPSKVRVIAELRSLPEQGMGPTGHWVTKGSNELGFKIRREYVSRAHQRVAVPNAYLVEATGMGKAVQLLTPADATLVEAANKLVAEATKSFETTREIDAAAAAMIEKHPCLRSSIKTIRERLDLLATAWLASGGPVEKWLRNRNDAAAAKLHVGLTRCADAAACSLELQLTFSPEVLAAVLEPEFSLDANLKKFNLARLDPKWLQKHDSKHREAADMAPRTYESGQWLFGKFENGFEVKVKELEVNDGGSACVLEVAVRDGPKKAWGKPSKSARQASVSTRLDPELFKGDNFTTAGFSYDKSQVHRDKLESRGWFIPRHLDPERFPGLQIVRQLDCADPFELKPTVPPGRTVVASYVGESDGGMAPGVEPATELLDTDFDGLCCHVLPNVSLSKMLSQSKAKAKSRPDAKLQAGTSGERQNVKNRDSPCDAAGQAKRAKLDVVENAVEDPSSIRAAQQDSSSDCSASIARSVARPLQAACFSEDQESVVVAVLGPSGSGKTSLVRHQLGKPLQPGWDEKKVVIEHFPDLALAEEVLFAAHLPLGTAMAPYGQLSRGEQSRADLARILAYGVNADRAGSPLVVEEFTSLLDRETAKIVASRMQLFLRKHQLPPLVLVSCHEDFVGAGMLEPQWVFETRPSCLSFLTAKASCSESMAALEPENTCGTPKSSSSSRKRSLSKGINNVESAAVMKKPARQVTSSTPSLWETVPRCLEEVRLEIRRALSCEWQFFREFHYKDHSLHATASCYVGVLDGHPVALTAAFPYCPNFIVLGKRGLNVMGGLDKGGVKPEFQPLPDTWEHWGMYREHRTVVLPDYQGTGIGSAMSDAIARDLQRRRFIFTSQTIHPFFGSYRERSPFWRPCASNRDYDQKGRAKYSHFWVGSTLPNGVEDKKTLVDLDKRVKIARILLD